MGKLGTAFNKDRDGSASDGGRNSAWHDPGDAGEYARRQQASDLEGEGLEGALLKGAAHMPRFVTTSSVPTWKTLGWKTSGSKTLAIRF